MHITEALLTFKARLEGCQDKKIVLTGLKGASSAWFVSRALEGENEQILWITEDQAQADKVLMDLSFFSGKKVLSFPSHESLAFMPLLPSPELLAQRILTLYELVTSGDQGVFLVCPIQAVMESTIPKDVLVNNVEFIQAGEEIDLEGLLDWLVRSGYERVPVVQAMGQFSMRGGILDVFSPGQDLPVRIDLFGDIAEQIRSFDPVTQRSGGDIDELVLLPCQELVYFRPLIQKAQELALKRASSYNWGSTELNQLLQRIEQMRLLELQRLMSPLFYNGFTGLLDHLPDGVHVILQDPLSLEAKAQEIFQQAQEAYMVARQKCRVLFSLSELMPEPKALFDRFSRAKSIAIDPMSLVGQEERTSNSDLKMDSERLSVEIFPLDLPVPKVASKGASLLGPVMARVQKWIDDGFLVVIATPGKRRAERMIELLRHHQVLLEGQGINVYSPPFQMDQDDNALKAGLVLFDSEISQGFLLKDQKIVLVSESDILGHIPRPLKKRKKKRVPLGDIGFEDLKPGQPVVHRDHGIGLYQGLVSLRTRGGEGEYLLLEYRGGDKLYLPVDRLGLIQRYIGIEGREPRLDKLGTGTWQATKQRVKKAIYEIAQELVDLYAARKVRYGHAFSPPDVLFRQFEAEFPFEETEDQSSAIDEVLSDMQVPRPMDRLLCGDVGFGKTEVAMRAAFKAVIDGKQVAVLVPTTLLAEQHERTFKHRFRRFPVNVAALSRLKTKKEQRHILEAVKDGRVDILIGTHRLLQADVVFRDLGLLIVDEEHRFGVRHKERLKRLRQTVDCLTLTATPIPRTLQLSLLGIRDLSTINTPPQDRLPIKTYLAELDDSLIKHAIEKELSRGGQVFFVHNRIKGIHRVADHIKSLVPKARVEVAHGQMSAAELEDIMIRFVRREVDCLVCTTIVESGLDIPSANTIIINRADKLGLADLYQLRGRVGRSNLQAFAYLLVPGLSHITKDARKRLRAVMEVGDVLGSGFKLAMHDLQIRGAGNILGVSQSGQIADVGYEMYLDLLQSAVEELKGSPRVELIDPEVNLGVDAYIPQDYVPDMEVRLGLYRRIARTGSEQEAQELMEELEDRFGPLPVQAINLFEIVELKRLLRRLNVTRLDLSQGARSQKLVFAFGLQGPPGLEGFVELVQQQKGLKLLPDGRLVVETRSRKSEGSDIQNVRMVLHTLLEVATRKGQLIRKRKKGGIDTQYE